jgi:hypothetical protein
LLISTLTLLLTSCSQSVLYNPAISLPVKPLEEKELFVQGSLGLLPETRPELLNGPSYTYAGCFQLGYGFSDRFSMSLSGWHDFEWREFATPTSYRLRYGYSITGVINKQINEKSTLLFIPRAVVALHDRMISGYGLGLSTGIHHKIHEKIGIYGAAGFACGFENTKKKVNTENELKRPAGLALIFNLGASGLIYKNFGWNFELSPIYTMNFFDNKQHFILSPQVGISYLINTKKNK